MTINISVIASSGSNGVGVHVQSDHPLNHLLHPTTAPGPYGVQVDVTGEGAFGGIAQLQNSLGNGVSGIAPSFLHLGFDSHELPDGLTIAGTGLNLPHLGIPDLFPFGHASQDSTVVKLHNLLDNTK